MEHQAKPAQPQWLGVDRYSWYVLGVLVLVYFVNFVDRQLLTILAVDIKRDLAITDSQFGFLYGTAFGVFYALFGIPLGKLADRWSRVRLLTWGLSLWSAMTVFSGLSRNFTQLGLARVGVGVGEATAGPCAYSLLSDYFPPHRRATAVAIYSSGIYIGGGLALLLGTSISGAWDHAFVAGERPFGLAGWQAAFLAVGAPGLLLAIWVNKLREPIRGYWEAARPPAPEPATWGAFIRDLGTIVPPFTMLAAARRGAKALFGNILTLGAVVLAAMGLTAWLGDPVQWIAIGIGVYAVASWAVALRHNDPEAFKVIWATPSVVGLNIGYGLICVVSYANSAFGPLYAIRDFGGDPGTVAVIFGGAGALGGALGVIAGGVMGDRVAASGRNSRRVLVVIGAFSVALIPYLILLTTPSITVAYFVVFPLWFCLSAALGSGSGVLVSIVPASVRATATAAFLLSATMIGLAMGPYAAGRMSHAFDSLRLGLTGLLVVVPFALVALTVSWRDLKRKEG